MMMNMLMGSCRNLDVVRKEEEMKRMKMKRGEANQVFEKWKGT